MMYKLLIVLSLTVAFNTLGASKRIARVDENGDTVFDRFIGLTADVVEVEISELDGSIYVSADNVGKLDENGYWDAGFDLPLFHQTYGLDVDDENYLWITGSESSDWGLYKYTSSGDYVDGLEGYCPIEADLNGLGYTWTADPIAGSPMNGIHKIRNDDFSRVIYIDGYNPYHATYDKANRNYWISNLEGGSDWSLVKFDDNGDELLTLNVFEGYKDPHASPVDGGCWFVGNGQNLFKVNAFGAVILRDNTFSNIAAIDVNESDGSVWVASNIPKRLVHLDKDGNRMLYKEWPGGDFAHLAEYRSGDLNIQPASVGEIKAMYVD
jgi:hypothetical protein